ncbi:MAG: SDR family oxidoreductase [Thermoleophilia bacterium]|nr:SDR family oxidoreductase [Thermoleophilia bacterium]
MKSVLVTGTSSGIGRATVQRLAGDGWLVFAGVRNQVDAKSLAAEPGEVVPIELDVTDPAQIEAAAEQVSAVTGGALDALVNNAGIGVAGPLETLPPDGLRQILDVNVVGQVAVTQALLPLLRRGHGRILFVGSVGGRVTHPWAAPYHASKFALEAIADCLRVELADQKVSVGLLEPGPIDTPIWAKSREQVNGLREELRGEARELYDAPLRKFQEQLTSAERKGEEPAKVAAKIADALGGSGSRYPVGRGVRTLVNVRPLLPDFVYDRLSGLFSR